MVDLYEGSKSAEGKDKGRRAKSQSMNQWEKGV